MGTRCIRITRYSYALGRRSIILATQTPRQMAGDAALITARAQAKGKESRACALQLWSLGTRETAQELNRCVILMIK